MTQILIALGFLAGVAATFIALVYGVYYVMRSAGLGRSWRWPAMRRREQRQRKTADLQ